MRLPGFLGGSVAPAGPKLGTVDVRMRLPQDTAHKSPRMVLRVKEDGIVVRGSKNMQKHTLVEPAASPSRSPTLHIADTRAPVVRVVASGSAYWLAAVHPGNARSNACIVLGNKGHRATPHTLEVGNSLRMGSVGVIVSEICLGPGNSQSLKPDEIAQLTKHVLSGNNHLMDTMNDFPDFADEPVDAFTSDEDVCYICYDGGSEDNLLVSPCECRGDTKHVHIRCLQRWNDSSTSRICFSASLNEGREMCTVCKTPYRSQVQMPDGQSRSLLLSKLPPPYVSFVVVSRQEGETTLRSSHCQVSASSLLDSRGAAYRPIVMGRASSCDVVLPFRTVSTQHAQLEFANGSFVLRDLRSSNGTLLLLRQPVALPFGRVTHVKLGRTLLYLTPKKRWFWRLRSSAAVRNAPLGSPPSLSGDEGGARGGSSSHGAGDEAGGGSAAAGAAPSPHHSTIMYSPQAQTEHRLALAPAATTAAEDAAAAAAVGEAKQPEDGAPAAEEPAAAPGPVPTPLASPRGAAIIREAKPPSPYIASRAPANQVVPVAAEMDRPVMPMAAEVDRLADEIFVAHNLRPASESQSQGQSQGHSQAPSQRSDDDFRDELLSDAGSMAASIAATHGSVA